MFLTLRPRADHLPTSSEQGKDVFLFNSGDIVDGTGLAGATPIDGEAILPIIKQVGADFHRGLRRASQSHTSLHGEHAN